MWKETGGKMKKKSDWALAYINVEHETTTPWDSPNIEKANVLYS